MYKHLESLKTTLTQLVETELYSVYKSDIRKHYAQFNKLREEIAEVMQRTMKPEEVSDAIHQLLHYTHFDGPGDTPQEFAKEFHVHLHEIINDLPEFVEVEQHQNRFIGQPNDSRVLKMRKMVKKMFFAFSDLPRRFANTFRKLPIKKTYWNHKVPLRSMVHKHLTVNFTRSCIGLRGRYLQHITKAYTQLLIDSVDQKTTLYESKNLQSALNTARNKLKKELLELLEAELELLNKNVELVDTIELRSSTYASKRLAAQLEECENKWQQESKEWNNTLLLLFEEWSSDLELRKLIEQANDALVTYHQSQAKTFEQSICPELDKILDFIQETRAEIDQTEELSQILKKSNYKAQKHLDEETIPRLLEVLTSKNTINAVARLENTINQGLKSMSIDLKLSKVATQYEGPIPTSNIATISLAELITFEIAPSLFAQLDKIKGRLIAELNQEVTLAGDLDHMITFGLSTAIQQLQEQTNSESAEQVALETLQRTEERVLEIKEALGVLFDKTHEELSTATSTYNKELEALMVNENIREMRLRIAKAKAIQQTKAYRTELRERTIRYLTNIQSAFSDQYKSTRSVLHNFRQQFFLTSKKESASRAVSDFLSTSQERINSLPVIYKNLYKIEPLADLELFVGRERELNQITEAYSNWMAGKMGSAILFGEKWSGMTSLLNYLQTSGSLKHPITRIKCETSLDSKGQFQHILRKILNTEEVAEYNITQEHLNSGPKRIVILEDIQNLYLRKTGGFDVVKSLLTMISNTSSNVFWLTSCTVYTWEYFKKTLSIHEIFSYPIGLQKPSEEDLSNIIQKRNRISGYKILFEADEDTRSSKRFGKMSSEEQQEHLRKKFFKNLIDFSESNVSMSLMFWLLSTKSVDQNQIVINSFQKPDLSFLGILKMDKVLALHALILHDGLTVEQFAQVMNCKTQAAFLQLSMMLEDGILIKKDNQYLVNTLVYRSVISLLKSKNLIY
ncbi:hypothetical protein [Marinoscillum sp.]|uniref:hypothetical protein n=1 Tax=Marinoscillum sp. TaxID=2024838 RepID=UPI003BAB04E9